MQMEIKRILLGTFIAFLVGTLSVAAQQTPGRHTVQQGETLYSLSQRYGVSVDGIIAANPSLKTELLKIGTVIMIPRQARGTGIAGSDCREMHKVAKKETVWSISQRYGITVDELIAANPEMKAEGYKLKKGNFLCIPYAKPQQAEVQKPVVDKSNALSAVNVAVVLPLTSGGVEVERSVEFYRGFLMAVGNLKRDGKNINVYAFNEPKSSGDMGGLISQLNLKDIDLVVGPLYPQNMAAMSAFTSQKQKTKWIQPFSSKVPQITTNPNLFLVNAPEKYLNESVARLFSQVFKDVKVVFLHSENGNEKNFSIDLIKALKTKQYDCTELAPGYTSGQMKAAMGQNRMTVFVPDASTKECARQVLEKIKWMKSLSPQGQFAVLGFLDWMEYAEELQEDMFAANTYVFANYFYNKYDKATIDFEKEYTRWFKTTPLSVYPRMGLLGHDVGIYAVGGLLKYGDDFFSRKAEGGLLQNELHFIRPVVGMGLVNDCMQFIHFRPDRVIDKMKLK